MQELDFNIEACIERWTDWHYFESDEDPASCCKTYDLSDPILIKVIKHGYVDIDLTSPIADYSCFNGRSVKAPLHYSEPDDQDALE